MDRHGHATVDIKDKSHHLAIRQAVSRAIENFREEHGREPNWDEVNFRGGTTTFDVMFEIIEQVEPE